MDGGRNSIGDLNRGHVHAFSTFVCPEALRLPKSPTCSFVRPRPRLSDSRPPQPPTPPADAFCLARSSMMDRSSTGDPWKATEVSPGTPKAWSSPQGSIGVHFAPLWHSSSLHRHDAEPAWLTQRHETCARVDVCQVEDCRVVRPRQLMVKLVMEKRVSGEAKRRCCFAAAIINRVPESISSRQDSTSCCRYLEIARPLCMYPNHQYLGT